jgi:hypothetical protein
MKDEILKQMFELRNSLDDLMWKYLTLKELQGEDSKETLQEVKEPIVEVKHYPTMAEEFMKPVPTPPKPTEAPEEQKKRKGIFRRRGKEKKPQNELESVKAKEKAYEDARKRLMEEIDKELADIRGKNVPT